MDMDSRTSGDVQTEETPHIEGMDETMDDSANDADPETMGDAGAHAPSLRPSHGRSTGILAVGTLTLVTGVVLALGVLPPQVLEWMPADLRPTTVLQGSAFLLVLGWLQRQHEWRALELRMVRETLARPSGGAAPSTTHADAVAERLAPAIQSVVSVLDAVEHAVERVRTQVEQMGTNFKEQERANLGLAGSVDRLGARIDKLSKERESKGGRGGASIAGELAPLQKSLEAISRDEHTRAARLHDGMSELHDALAEMEGRIRERMQPLEKGALSGLAEELTALEGRLRVPMDERLSAIEDRLALIVKGLESGALAPAPMRTEQPMPSRDDVSREPAAALPVGEGEPAAAATMSEGPKESRTVLRAIDKLRALRGS